MIQRQQLHQNQRKSGRAISSHTPNHWQALKAVEQKDSFQLLVQGSRKSKGSSNFGKLMKVD